MSYHKQSWNIEACKLDGNIIISLNWTREFRHLVRPKICYPGNCIIRWIKLCSRRLKDLRQHHVVVVTLNHVSKLDMVGCQVTNLITETINTREHASDCSGRGYRRELNRIKLISNALDITFHVLASILYSNCDVISNRLWCHQQNVTYRISIRFFKVTLHFLLANHAGI